MAKGPPPYGRKKRPDRARDSRLRRGGFLRETFVLPRPQARRKAREWYESRPKQAYWTAVESRRERPDDVIEFTMRRLPSAD